MAKNAVVFLSVLFVVAAIAAVAFAVLYFTKPMGSGGGSTMPMPTTTATPMPTSTTATPMPTSTARPTPPPSTSAGWQRVAEMLDEAMDESVDPCNDFYHFACGGYIKDPANALNGSAIKNPIYDSIKRVNEAIARGAMKVMMNSNATAMTLKKAKVAFDKCLNPSSAETQLRDLMQIVNQKYPGWPALTTNFQHPGIDFDTEMGMLGHEFGVDGWFGSMVSYNFFELDTDIRTWTFYAQPPANPGLGPGTPADVEEALFQKIRDTTQRVNEILQLGVPMDQIVADARPVAHMVVMLQQLAAANAQPEQLQTNLADAMARWPFVNWMSYFRSYAGDYVDPNVLLTRDFGVLSPNYLAAANAFIMGMPANDRNRIMQNFLMWNLFDSFHFGLISDDKALKQIDDDYTIAVFGEKAVGPLETACGRFLLGQLPMPASRLFIDEYFNKVNDPWTRAKVQDMAKTVTDAVHQMMHNVEWLTAQSKKGAYDKVYKLSRNIGYPDWLVNDLNFDHRYMNLDVTPDQDGFTVGRKVMEFHQMQEIQKLGGRAGTSEWILAPAAVNSFEMAILNAIFIDAGIIDEPSYNYKFPQAFNYASLGSTIGHEIMHGFAAQGAQFNGDGLLVPWMDQQSMIKFNEMTQCVIDQYNKICYDLPAPIGKICINGALSMPDNMADNAGISASFRAYKRAMDMYGPEPRLPGRLSKYTLEQVFFISYSYAWCTNIDPRILQLIMTNPRYASHAPNSARVFGVMPNIPEWGKAFNCPIGSPMAPRKHCNVWIPKM